MAALYDLFRNFSGKGVKTLGRNFIKRKFIFKKSELPKDEFSFKKSIILLASL